MSRMHMYMEITIYIYMQNNYIHMQDDNVYVQGNYVYLYN